MFFSTKTLAALATSLLLGGQQVAALGINCRGSGLCPLASFDREGDEGILQGLRDAMYTTNVTESTHYNDGDHIICVSSSLKITINPSISAGYKGASADLSVGLSGRIGNGGVCVFAQNTGSKGVTLGQARSLLDGLLDHGCTTCGSNPTEPGNNVKNGQVTVNYVGAPGCTHNCLSDGAGTNPTAGQGKRALEFAA